MHDVIVARALHVLGVVVWIGGVAMATMVVLPAVRAGQLGTDRHEAFQAIESRFVWIARAAVLVVGLSGLYMLARLDLWSRFRGLEFWWMHAMVCLWLVFAFILFIGEPFILHRRFARRVAADPDAAFARLHRLHWILLLFSLITVFGAVAGVHGWSLFTS
jgi:uncharacterized membrane protein